MLKLQVKLQYQVSITNIRKIYNYKSKVTITCQMLQLQVKLQYQVSITNISKIYNYKSNVSITS